MNSITTLGHNTSMPRSVRNAPLVIFDEATSSLDYETESDIKKEIYKMAEDKTMIIITHRLSTLAGIDRIYHIEDGSITEKQAGNGK